MAAVIGLLALALLLILVAPVDRLAPAALGAATAPAIDDVELGGAIGAAALITALLGWRTRPAGRARDRGHDRVRAPRRRGCRPAGGQLPGGWLEGALDYTSNGAVQLGSLVGAVVDRRGRVRRPGGRTPRRREAGRGPHEAPSGWPRRWRAAGRPRPSSAWPALAAGVALGFSSRASCKEFGLGTAAGLLLELLVVQLLLAPALLRFTRDRSSRQ